MPARVSQTNLTNAGASITVQGRYAYVVDSNTNNSLEVWDVSNPASPIQVTRATLSNNGYAMVAQGRYAYVVEQGTTNGLEIFDIGGEYVQQIEAGNVSTSSLSVQNNMYGQDLSLSGGLIVSGNFIAEGDVNIGGHISSQNGSVPAVSSCGTSPSINATSTDIRGTIVLGTGSPSSCTLTFSRAFSFMPYCTVTGSNNAYPVAVSFSSASTITISFNSALTGSVNYQCIQ